MTDEHDIDEAELVELPQTVAFSRAGLLSLLIVGVVGALAIGLIVYALVEWA